MCLGIHRERLGDYGHEDFESSTVFAYPSSTPTDFSLGSIRRASFVLPLACGAPTDSAGIVKKGINSLLESDREGAFYICWSSFQCELESDKWNRINYYLC